MPLYRHLTHSHTGKETVVLNCTILHLWPPHLPTLGPWLLMDVADRRPVFTPTFFHNINANRSVSSWCITPWSRPVFAIPFSTAASKLRCNVKKKLPKFVCSRPSASYPSLFSPSPTNSFSNPHLPFDLDPSQVICMWSGSRWLECMLIHIGTFWVLKCLHLA